MLKQSWKTLLLSMALIAALGGGGLWWWITSGYVSTDDARIKADIVAVSAELTGRIESLTKTEGDRVKRDEVLASLDRHELEIQIQQAEAELERLQSKVRQGSIGIALYEAKQKEEVTKAEASLRASRHSYDESRAHATQARDDWSRNQKLFEKQLVAEQELDRAKTLVRQYDAQMAALKEKIKEGESLLDLARIAAGETAAMQAELEARQAEARRAAAVLADLRRKLQLTVIRSPVSGVVVKKSANRGEVTQMGQAIFMIVDDSRYWVEANVEETEFRHVKPGQAVTIRVDSYPDRNFAGTVTEVGGATVAEFSLFNPQKLTGQFIKSTQRLPVKISIDNKDGLLKVGMLAVV
ncbi:MAG TPA: HlyD family secretion protein, partial [Candidatus Limnocylindria bacterium]|nr:HlyD family secretion protein [Candidatus Limnocylindria bacterium]